MTVAIAFVLVLPAMCTQAALRAASAGMRVATLGIALFILPPVMRLILMLGMCLHQRDDRFSAIATLVPAIVAAGLLVGAA